MKLPAPDPDAQTVLDYDRTEFRFPGVYMMSFKAWQVKKSIGIPHGVRYAFNLFAPDADGEPNTPILRFDNEHAPRAIKHPFDHWHPPKRGPGGWPMDVERDQPHAVALIDLPVVFIEKSYALLKEMGVDIHQGTQAVGPQRKGSKDDDARPPGKATSKVKARSRK